jgi:hypothetical protein
MTGAAGLSDPSGFLPHHLMQRQSDRSMVQGNKAFPYLPIGFLVDDTAEDHMGYKDRWSRASAESFTPPEYV